MYISTDYMMYTVAEPRRPDPPYFLAQFPSWVLSRETWNSIMGDAKLAQYKSVVNLRFFS